MKKRVNLTIDEGLWERVELRSGLTGASRSWLVEAGLRLLLRDAPVVAEVDGAEKFVEPSPPPRSMAPIRPAAAVAAYVARPFKCPSCAWRTANSKESCPRHQRQPVVG